VTESGIFKFACINSFHAKNSIYNPYQKVQPFLLLFVVYLYKFSPLNGFINFITNESKITPSVLIYFQKVPGACLCLDSMHMIHLSKTGIQAVKVLLDSWEERNHSISYSIFKKCQVLVFAWIQCT
jgi:hypothetical protein